MIRITRLDRAEFVLNCDLIESIEARPDTTIRLVTGQSRVVRESLGAGSFLQASSGVTLTDLDATLDAVDLDGTWSSTEDTSIATLDADTLEITTPAIAGSFSPPTVMRKKEPAT